MEKSGREKTNKNKNKTSAQEQKQAGTHTLPGCKQAGERLLCSAQRLAEVRPPCSPSDPGQYRLLRRVWLGLAASLTHAPVFNPSTQSSREAAATHRASEGLGSFQWFPECLHWPPPHRPTTVKSLLEASSELWIWGRVVAGARCVLYWDMALRRLA